jgi:hypothetical protein
MDESKLFKNIWRFNSIIIAVFGIIIICILVLAYISSKINKTNYDEILNINPQSNIEENFRLGTIRHVTGYKSVIVPLNSYQTNFALKSGSTKTTSVSTRNLLFSNMHNETNKWLLPTNKYLIKDYILINESNENIITILYKIVKTDTNNDSKLTVDDKLTIAFSEPTGIKYTEVIDNIDSVLGYEMLDNKAIAIMFNRDGKGYIAYIDLSNFTIKKEIALPTIN